jgi:hypothetical protein
MLASCLAVCLLGQPKTTPIVPGSGIGAVSVGMPVAGVRAKMGGGERPAPTSNGFIDSWQGKRGNFAVMYWDNGSGYVADCIVATSPSFRTAKGCGPGASMATFKTEFPKATKRGVIKLKSGKRMTSYRQADAGLTFLMGDDNKCILVVVHPAKPAHVDDLMEDLWAYTARP